MIAKKLLSLPDLTRTQAFCIYEAAKVVLVDKNKDYVLIIFYIMPLCFESLNNGQKLIVVSFVSSFGWNHFL